MSSWLTDIRGRVPLMPSILLGALPILALLAIWWLLTAGPVEERTISPTILPSPGEVAGQVPELFAKRTEDGGNALLHHVLSSLRRVWVGFLIGCAVALPIGIAAGAFGSVRAMVAPLMTAAGYIPIATLVPLTMSWFGTDEKQKYIFLAMAFAIYLLPQVVKAIDAVPDVFARTAFTLGSSRLHVVRKVLVPIALPDLWHALRLAFGVGWTYIVLTEALVLSDGLGFLVETARRRGPREQIYLAILIITAIAWLADLLWERIGRRLFPYRMRR
ncbi:MAG: ABC transporter permease subunit [Planctomycetes bacterium]|nr:ABC transporter permease subunit [Planctomycetota bacterium]